jgi:hypothetical protein
MASWLGSPTSVNQVPIVANAGEVAVSGVGGTFFTTGTLPAGTYLAGMTVSTSGTFISTDYALLRIVYATGSSTTFPDQSMAFVNNIAGSTGTILTNMVGMVVLTVPTTLVYSVSASTSTSHTYTAEGMWYQRIA